MHVFIFSPLNPQDDIAVDDGIAKFQFRFIFGHRAGVEGEDKDVFTLTGNHVVFSHYTHLHWARGPELANLAISAKLESKAALEPCQLELPVVEENLFLLILSFRGDAAGLEEFYILKTELRDITL